MEKVVKQIQLIALIIILISTVIAFCIEIIQMFENKKISLADLILLFLYLEVLAMVRVFWESQSIQITLPLFIAITALSRFIIILFPKSGDPFLISTITSVIAPATTFTNLPWGFFN